MASISKLLPSFTNASLEIAPALANVNFDFSLFKVEPPKEFEGVGNALSKIRRESAESGMPHITARKLGALFEHLLPPTPNLFNAYGRRASEISESSSVDPEGRRSYGVFASQVGADATSLWAAATSGQGAIAIHMLACMLARIWDGPEATSIWVEIIEKQQTKVVRDFEEKTVIDMGSFMAAKQPISREQIREWDASARAWLRAADSVKRVQQKQLSLIIDNIKLPVNRKADTYESVIEAWKNSLAQMEGLVNGISQNARHGDVLLASGAWHLYPDMMVVVPTATQVRQNDPIFSSGGMLTIGLENPRDVDCSGVYWSLPLARLRHYGAPVTSVQTIDSRERSRVSIDEFLQISLGCFLQSWGEIGQDTLRLLRWLQNLSNMIESVARRGHSDAQAILNAQGSWLSLMLHAAKSRLQCSDADQKTASSLILLGRKHGNNFLGLSPRPMLGLSERGLFVGFLKSEEDRINYLRQVAKVVVQKLGLKHNEIFIRYARKFPHCDTKVYEYATAVPREGKRKYEHFANQRYGHHRWLYAGGTINPVSAQAYHVRLDHLYSSGREVPPDFWAWHQSLAISGPRLDFLEWKNNQEFPAENFFEQLPITEADTSGAVLEEWSLRKKSLLSNGESVSPVEYELIGDFRPEKMGLFWSSQHGAPTDPVWFKYLWGDLDSAALFVRELSENLLRVVRDPIMDSQDLLDLSEKGALSEELLVTRLAVQFRFSQMENDPHLRSLKALSTAAELYKDLTCASVDIRVFQKKLYETPWLPKLDLDEVRSSSGRDLLMRALRPFVLDRPSAFACLAFFETGIYNPDPYVLQNVMAMSSADSLFVSAALLCDPSELKAPGAIKHIVGNIGRPGIVFLVPPENPMVREAQMSDWPVISHETFNGEMKNSFENTTLHLSFTNAESPISLGFSGAQDVELYLLQTLISVHDRGKWVADLNILNSLDSTNNRSLPQCSEEHHSETKLPRYTMTSIDDWLELLDPSEGPLSIVRAHKNWQARLAALTISIAKGNTTVVCPSKTCWRCFELMIASLSEVTRRVVAIG